MRVICVFAVFILVSAFGGSERFFAPDKDLWGKWEAQDPESEKTIDHSLWHSFLDQHLIVEHGQVARIDYGNIPHTSKQQLASYIQASNNIQISKYNRREQQAFWINLYNAAIVKVIIDHYPVESIKDISLSTFSNGPWFASVVWVEGSKLSFNDIEHRILRPIWNDARLHYALNCASIGCPPLQGRAVTAENTEDYLEVGAETFINSTEAIKITSGKISVSKIYDWYFEDFGGTDELLLDHIRSYADSALISKLKNFNKIDFAFYNWSLNDVLQKDSLTY